MLENTSQLMLDFKKLSKIHHDVIPVVIQDFFTKEVLILAYTHQDAFEKTLKTKTVVLFSTSKGKTWEKGKSSGQYLELIEARVNCEQNSLLYLVRLKGQGACHTKTKEGLYNTSCFYRRIQDDLNLNGLS